MEYLSKLNCETKFLETNYMKCCEMDFKLGKNPTVTENSEDTTSKGKLKCPIQSCTIQTVKLKRHLEKHNLSEENLKYGMACSKMFAENSTPVSPSKENFKYCS